MAKRPQHPSHRKYNANKYFNAAKENAWSEVRATRDRSAKLKHWDGKRQFYRNKNEIPKAFVTKQTVIKSRNAQSIRKHYTTISDMAKKANYRRPAMKAAPAMSLNLKTVVENVKKAQDVIKAASTKLISNKWARNAAVSAVVILAFNTMRDLFSRGIGSNKPAIPREYERGYDIINSYGDFGSPVKLDKVTSKTITPYYSTVRKAPYTTVRSTIDTNLALSSHASAIRHASY